MTRHLDRLHRLLERGDQRLQLLIDLVFDGLFHPRQPLLAALLHRRETGEGQFIDLSQVQCMLPFTAAWAIEQSANGRVTPRAGNRHPAFVPHGVFPSAGADKWVSIAVTDDAMWPALARIIGLDDPAFATAAGRRAQEDRIEASIATWTSTRSPDEAMEILQEAGVAAGAVRNRFSMRFSARSFSIILNIAR